MFDACVELCTLAALKYYSPPDDHHPMSSNLVVFVPDACTGETKLETQAPLLATDEGIALALPTRTLS